MIEAAARASATTALVASEGRLSPFKQTGSFLGVPAGVHSPAEIFHEKLTCRHANESISSAEIILTLLGLPRPR